MIDYEVFALEDCTLQAGGMLPDARLAYKTYGALDAERSNAIVFPTHYSGVHTDNEWLIGAGKALDPGRYFIIVPNMLGNGLSSSPSNTPAPHGKAGFPRVTVYDNVEFQHRLVTERFGVERLQMVVGFSMGAQQSYQWAVSYPRMVERCVPICGSARTSPHNWVFLEGVTAALRADAAWQNGAYERPPVRGLRAMGRVWAGWGVSQAFYREHMYLQAGYASLEDYIVRNWEDSFLRHDANDLLAMAWTWQHADIGATPGFAGDFKGALSSITARTLVMPCATDLYFPPEDNAYEVEHIAGAELRPIPSIWGHGAGGGTAPADAAFIDTSLREWLALDDVVAPR
jgi:homoserine O-acetyltransferase/O-succinyltransferase